MKSASAERYHAIVKTAAEVPQNLRNIVFERDSYTCALCSKAASDCHHVRPRSLGGRNTPDNLVSLCRCHHCLVHGERWHGVELTTEEAKQAILEYVDDYHAVYGGK